MYTNGDGGGEYVGLRSCGRYPALRTAASCYHTIVVIVVVAVAAAVQPQSWCTVGGGSVDCALYTRCAAPSKRQWWGHQQQQQCLCVCVDRFACRPCPPVFGHVPSPAAIQQQQQHNSVARIHIRTHRTFTVFFSTVLRRQHYYYY